MDYIIEKDEDPSHLQIISLEIPAHNPHSFWRTCDRQNLTINIIDVLNVHNGVIRVLNSVPYGHYSLLQFTFFNLILDAPRPIIET